MQNVATNKVSEYPSFVQDITMNSEATSIYETNVTPPPYSTTDCLIRESTSSTPEAIRFTMYKLPITQTALNKVSMPFSAVIQPFNPKIPYLREERSAQCNECFSYANNFTNFDFFKGYFLCNICGNNNYSKTIFKDSEILKRPSVIYNGRENTHIEEEIDSVGNRYYDYSKIKGANLIISVEFTASSINSKFYKSVMQSIKKIFLSSKLTKRFKKFTIILFNEDILIPTIEKEHFVIKTINSGNVFIPNEFSINFDENINKIESLFDFLLNLNINNIRNPKIQKLETNLLFEVINSVSRNFLGSKTIMMSSQILNLNENYQNYIEEFSDNNNALFYISLKRSVESSMTRFCTETCGKMREFFLEEILEKNYLENFVKNICEIKTFFGVKVEIKNSGNLRKSRIYANTVESTSLSTFFPQMDTDSTFACSWEYDGSLSENETIYFQISATFLDENMEKKVLVLNNSLTSSNNFIKIYENFSYDSIFSVLVKFISEELHSTPLKIEKINQMLLSCLKTFKDLKTLHSKSALVVPSTLKNLIVLIQSLMKNKNFSKNLNLSAMREISAYPIKNLVRYFYPRLVNIYDYFIENNYSSITKLELSYKKLDFKEIYILENTDKIFILIGNEADDEVVKALFMEDFKINEDTNEGLCLLEIIDEIKRCYYKEMDVLVIQQGRDNREAEFISQMVEDKLNGVDSLNEFVKKLHYKIQALK